MKSNKLLLRAFGPAFALLIFAGCFLGNSETPAPAPAPTIPPGLPNGITLPALGGANVLSLTVNGSTCAPGSYPNKPCVNVTLCAPGSTTNCQTINDILVDTGSYGLRVFKSAISASVASALTPLTSGGQAIAECVQFGDGSSTWGPVEKAGVVLGGETAVQVPIQVIDSTYTGASANCVGAETSPMAAGFNGILGVGLFPEDCGSGCATSSANGIYFTCNGTSCSGAAIAVTSQVQNPVNELPVDNNGVILELPSIPLGGELSVNGYLVLGIGTQSNNAPSGVTAFPSDNVGQFSTSFQGKTLTSFLDSGSNGLFFPAPATIPDCSTINAGFTGWYCPSSTMSLKANNIGSGGAPNGGTIFDIGNMYNLAGSSNYVFIEIGANAASGMFDWGLPFYLGRNVYVGIQNRSSVLGSGPYWAY